MVRLRRALVWIAASVAVLTGARAASGAIIDAIDDPERLCVEAIAAAERAKGIPRHLLAAIGLAESGKWNAARKALLPWPWTVTAEGYGRFLATKAEAMMAVDVLRARGVRSIDVGCLQVNLHYHPNAFANLEEAFDPLANIAYGAGYLKALFGETGSWPLAAGRYHSATPGLNVPYRLKVLQLWNERWQSELGLREAGAPRDVMTAPADARVVARWRLASLGDPRIEVRIPSDGAPPPTTKAPTGVAVLRGRSQRGPNETEAKTASDERRGRLLEPWRQKKAGGQGSTFVTVLRGSSQQTDDVRRR